MKTTNLTFISGEVAINVDRECNDRIVVGCYDYFDGIGLTMSKSDALDMAAALIKAANEIKDAGSEE